LPPTESRFEALTCTGCGRRYPARLRGLCDDCGSALLATYEPSITPPADEGLWAWREWLPPCEPVSLGEVSTPLVPLGRDESARPRVLIKDESRLPTGTFKARGAAVGVAMAKHLGAEGVVLPTAGNAGAAWAAYCAKAGLPLRIFLAAEGPRAQADVARVAGAVVTEVSTIDDAVEAASSDADKRGWHYAATFREPWRVEGKKTALFEIWRDLGELPAAAVLPVGGGVGAIAFHLAAAQLQAAGLAGAGLRTYAVQAAGCAPVVRAFDEESEEPERWLEPKTVAAGIKIPLPPEGGMLLRIIRESGGSAVAVSEEEISAERNHVARSTGLIPGPEAAAAVAGYRRLESSGAFGEGEAVVVYATGGG
jgi:threonine synthase